MHTEQIWINVPAVKIVTITSGLELMLHTAVHNLNSRCERENAEDEGNHARFQCELKPGE